MMGWLMRATFVMSAARGLRVEGGSSLALLDELSVVILGDSTDVSATPGC